MSEANLSQEYSDLPAEEPEIVETPEIEAESVEIEVETPENEVETAEVAAEDARIRAIAEAQGWRPEGKLSPMDFLEAIPKYSEGLVSKLKAAEDRIAKLQKAVGAQISEANERARKEAEQRLVEATERGDTQAALKAAEELHAQREDFDEPAPVAEPVNEVQAKLKAWTERPEQAWFRTDAEMAQDAAALYNAEVNKRGGRDDPDVILPIIDKRIRALYPDKFPRPNPNRSAAPGSPTASAARPVQTARKPASAEGLVDPTVLAQYRRMGLSDADIIKSLESFNGR